MTKEDVLEEKEESSKRFSTIEDALISQQKWTKLIAGLLLFISFLLVLIVGFIGVLLQQGNLQAAGQVDLNRYGGASSRVSSSASSRTFSRSRYRRQLGLERSLPESWFASDYALPSEREPPRRTSWFASDYDVNSRSIPDVNSRPIPPSTSTETPVNPWTLAIQDLATVLTGGFANVTERLDKIFLRSKRVGPTLRKLAKCQAEFTKIAKECLAKECLPKEHRSSFASSNATKYPNGVNVERPKTTSDVDKTTMKQLDTIINIGE